MELNLGSNVVATLKCVFFIVLLYVPYHFCYCLFLFHAFFFFFKTWCLHSPQCNLNAEVSQRVRCVMQVVNIVADSKPIHQ